MGLILRRRAPLTAAVGVSTWLASAGMAAVLDLSAMVESTLQERVSGGGGSSDSAFEEYPGTATTLPMEARSALTRFGSSEQVVAAGVARALFNDPRLSDQATPQDFGIDMALSSNDPATSYSARARSKEDRTVQLSPGELLQTAGTEVGLRSQFYLNGAVVVWASSPTADLTGLEAVVTLRVVQQRADESQQTVLEASVRVTGAEAGQVNLQAEGAIGEDNLVSLDLAGVLGAIDGAEIQRLQVVVFPNMVLNYSYAAAVGETFTLNAELDVQAANLPGGTGVAAVFGVPFEALGQVVGDVIDETTGAALQGSIGAAIAAAPAPAVPLTGRVSLCCFPFGLAAMVLVIGLLVVGTATRTRGGMAWLIPRRHVG